MEENKIILTAFDFAKQCHAADTTGHDLDHIMRVYHNACTLLEKEKTANEVVVKVAALLHDVDDRKLSKEERLLPFLNTLEIDDTLRQQIYQTATTISFSDTGTTPHFGTLEQKIVFDADKLDSMGAIGICRTIVYGAVKGRRLFDKDLFPNVALTKEEYRQLQEKNDTSINHLFNKLLRLHLIMQTQAGREISLNRLKTMTDFLNAFFEEQKLDNWKIFLHEFLEQNIRKF